MGRNKSPEITVRYMNEIHTCAHKLEAGQSQLRRNVDFLSIVAANKA